MKQRFGPYFETYLTLLNGSWNEGDFSQLINELVSDLPPLFVPPFKLEFVQYFPVKTITKKDESAKQIKNMEVVFVETLEELQKKA